MALLSLRNDTFNSPGISKSTTDENATLDFIVRFNCFAIFVIVLFGIITNILNILVLSKGKTFSRSTTVSLLSLATIDLIFLSTMPIRKIDCLIAEVDSEYANWVLANVRHYGFRIMNRIWAYISISHIVVISLERVVAVYLPMTVNQIVTPKRTAILLACIYIFWMALMGPFIVTFSYKTLVDVNNKTVHKTVLSDFFRGNRPILSPIMRYVINNFRGSLSMGIVVAASLAVGIKLYLVSKQRSNMLSQKTTVDFKAFRTLLTICLLYVVVGIPNSMQAFMNNFSSTTNIFTPAYNFIVATNDLFLVINSSSNFLVYFFTSKRFSDKLKEMLCEREKEENKK